MSQKYILLIFKGICMNFSLELNFFILSHSVTSKQPHKIVQIHMRHPVGGCYSDGYAGGRGGTIKENDSHQFPFILKIFLSTWSLIAAAFLICWCILCCICHQIS